MISLTFCVKFYQINFNSRFQKLWWISGVGWRLVCFPTCTILIELPACPLKLAMSSETMTPDCTRSGARDTCTPSKSSAVKKGATAATPTRIPAFPATSPAERTYSNIDATISGLLNCLSDVQTPAPYKGRPKPTQPTDVAALLVNTPHGPSARCNPAKAPADQKANLQIQELQSQVSRLEASRDELARQLGDSRGTVAKLQGAVSSGERRVKQQAVEIEQLKVSRRAAACQTAAGPLSVPNVQQHQHLQLATSDLLYAMGRTCRCGGLYRSVYRSGIVHHTILTASWMIPLDPYFALEQ